ncbi:hypothetical protein GCM10023189_43050 [Nibrella saemangeumensis]|uniref:Uncharacterized protein n=1 Tax=Nibrella saemangeumensis TaxID=1084526 RepID=A0ABP8NEY1_9BACT
MLWGCVEVVDNPKAVNWSVQADTVGMVHASEIDSLAIYQCDDCAFAVRYRSENRSQVKHCPTCPWEEFKESHTQRRHASVRLNGGNPPTEVISEKDDHAPPVASAPVRAERYHEHLGDNID